MSELKFDIQRAVRRRGVGFLGRGRRNAILVSHEPGWEQRLFTRMARKNGRARRTIQRMRAAGEEV